MCSFNRNGGVTDRVGRTCVRAWIETERTRPRYIAWRALFIYVSISSIDRALSSLTKWWVQKLLSESPRKQQRQQQQHLTMLSPTDQERQHSSSTIAANNNSAFCTLIPHRHHCANTRWLLLECGAQFSLKHLRGMSTPRDCNTCFVN